MGFYALRFHELVVCGSRSRFCCLMSDLVTMGSMLSRQCFLVRRICFLYFLVHDVGLDGLGSIQELGFATLRLQRLGFMMLGCINCFCLLAVVPWIMIQRFPIWSIARLWGMVVRFVVFCFGVMTTLYKVVLVRFATTFFVKKANGAFSVLHKRGLVLTCW